MFIKDFDFLSRKIGIFFHGRKRHVSIAGGILTIIMITSCVVYIGHLIIDIFQHKSSSYVSYTKYEKDINEFSFNESGLFHFFQFMDIKNDNIGKYDSEYIRIYMTNLHQPYSIEQETLENNEHWIYDSCRKGLDDTFILRDVFMDNEDENDFINGACLRYYYNNNDKTYYSIEDKINFKFPVLTQKTKNNTTYLNTIIEKCSNNSISNKVLGNCAKVTEIEEYLNIYKGIYLNFLEYQVNTYNYSKPIIQYINPIYTEISNFYSSYIQINNINLSPFNIKLQKGLLYPLTEFINTYIYKSNIQSNIYELSNKNIISVFNYEILNLCNVFEGGYNTLYDVLPSVGGIIQLIYYVLFCFNYFIDRYTIIQDSQNLFFKLNDNNGKIEKEKQLKFVKTVISARNSFKFEGNHNILRYTSFPKIYPIKSIKNENNNNNEINSINEISSFHKICNEIHDRNDISQLNFSKEQKQKKFYRPYSSFNSYNSMNKEDIVSSDKNLMSNSPNFNTIINKNKIPNRTFSLFKNNLQNKNRTSIIGGNCNDFSKNFINYLSLQKSNIKLEILSETYLKKNTSFLYYLITLMGNITHRRKPFLIINGFREKLLSEEHFFRSHIYLYYLVKYFDIMESGKIDIAELYNYL